MNISPAPSAYDRSDQQRMREVVALEDLRNVKKGSDVLLVNGERVVLKSPNGSFWALSVSNLGVLTAVVYP